MLCRTARFGLLFFEEAGKQNSLADLLKSKWRKTVHVKEGKQTLDPSFWGKTGWLVEVGVYLARIPIWKSIKRKFSFFKHPNSYQYCYFYSYRRSLRMWVVKMMKIAETERSTGVIRMTNIKRAVKVIRITRVFMTIVMWAITTIVRVRILSN